MLFNSFDFLIFLPIVLVTYYLVPIKFRWVALSIASLFFLFWGSLSSLIVLLSEIIIIYFASIYISSAKNTKKKKLIFWSTIVMSFCVLLYYKYLSLIVTNIISILRLNLDHSKFYINEMILPLGISFYTFQAVSYLIEVNRGSIKPEQHFGYFFTYMTFFPKLIAGPIERSYNFIPQIKLFPKLDWNNLENGFQRMLWGFFKKLVVADRINIYTSSIFTTYENQDGATIFLALLLYTFQIYADFSGYTDIALGVSKMFGYDLMENFKFPLYAKSITDFWRRWHISLSSWANDYIYTPITIIYRDWGTKSIIAALFLTFFVIGIWHGPSLSFIIFGIIQGFAIIYELKTKKIRKKIFDKLPKILSSLISHFSVIMFLVFSFIFFNFLTINSSINVIRKICFNFGTVNIPDIYILVYSLIGIIFIIFVELLLIKKPNSTFYKNENCWILNILWNVMLIILILLIGVFDGGQFIYFAY